MLLESLEAQNFRNIEGKIPCGKNLNIIFGENGQGKTNWLEAIYLLATTKSFQNRQTFGSVKFDEELAIIRGTVRQSAEIHRNLQVALQGNTKILTVNNKKETDPEISGRTSRDRFQFRRTRNRARHARRAAQISRRRHRFDLSAVRPDSKRLQPRYSPEKLAFCNRHRTTVFHLDKVSELLEPWNEQLIQLATRIYKARFVLSKD